MKLLNKKPVLLTLTAGALLFAISVLTPSSDAAYFQSAKSLYLSKCAVCHGNDGSANTAKGKELKVRPLNSAEFKKMTDAKALEIILKGKGKMEAYEKTLGKEKCEMLLAYCRELGK
ncbi:MAG: cytochrome c [Acidobacteria bacterium]|nr:cytochrome c [Acidobacteriota bacterium]